MKNRYKILIAVVACIAAVSYTHLLCELGLADKIVGIDNRSPNYTDQLKDDLPQFDMMSVDTETLIALKPDIVFASGISYVGAEDPFKSVRDVGCLLYTSHASLWRPQRPVRWSPCAACTAPDIPAYTGCRPPAPRSPSKYAAVPFSHNP